MIGEALPVLGLADGLGEGPADDGVGLVIEAVVQPLPGGVQLALAHALVVFALAGQLVALGIDEVAVIIALPWLQPVPVLPVDGAGEQDGAEDARQPPRPPLVHGVDGLLRVGLLDGQPIDLMQREVVLDVLAGTKHQLPNSSLAASMSSP